ncbi:GspE/PulE family protein [Holospora curviuscula]|uniref:Type II secretion system protein E n=1 Tax=Holospora curviuscula TaxID=1082868 RepID=A0A2S5R7U1_9PROT|nr:type II/IV secretion system protein [Holospora curviuscula]PPE03252.1 Type II secretion system protein E [Holospora curviuscula]
MFLLLILSVNVKMRFLSFRELSREETMLLSKLRQDNILSLDQEKIVLLEHQHSGIDIKKLILDWGILSEAKLLEFIASIHNLPYFSLKDPNIQLAWDVVSVELLHQVFIVPIRKGDVLYILMPKAQDLPVQDLVRCCVKVPFQWALGTTSEIQNALKQVQKKVDLHALFSDQHHFDDQVISQFLYHTLSNAVNEGVSDIHFEPEKFSVRVRYRYDGLLRTICCFHLSFWSATCIQIKVLSGMDIAESRNPQDGRFSFALSNGLIDVRSATHPTYYGENVVLRILNRNQELRSLKELGYDALTLSTMTQFLSKPEGLLVITGPTGCGKTSTLYAMVHEMDSEALNIMTLEEPIEYKISGIRQTEVREESPMTFAKGVRSILRQDPDVILIGEIRNEETAAMAVRAAMTGHHVLTTLHATHVLGVFYRMLEFNISLTMTAGLIHGVISQRLVRILCRYCCIVQKEALEEPQFHGIQGLLYQAVGCEFCKGTGYKGRKALAEILVMNGVIESMILEQRPYWEIKRALYASGFEDLAMQGKKLVEQGITSWVELKRVIGI